MRTLTQIDSTVSHLNQILSDQQDPTYYTVEPIAGTDNLTMWQYKNGIDTHIATTDSETMYTIVYAFKHAHSL